MSRLPIARSGSATAASSSRTSRSAIASTLGALEQVGAVFQHPVDPRRRAVRPRAARVGSATGRTWRCAVATGSSARLQPRQARGCTGALFCNASITWNSGWRASDRAGLRTSTRRSNGNVLVRCRPPELLARTRASSSRKLGLPDVSGAQHQRVHEEPDQIVERAIGATRQSGCRSACRCPRPAASAAPQAQPAAP